MSQQQTILCDCCAKRCNILTSYPHNWILCLRSFDAAVHDTQSSYSLLMPNPLPAEHHFCDFVCLTTWLEKRQ